METHQSMDQRFLDNVHQKIEANIDNEDYSVEQLASDIGLSRSMLHRKLIKLTGKSASETITEIRLKCARELLQNNAATVSETAYRVGFKNPSYFNKVFKQHYKMSPGDVRRSAMPDITMAKPSESTSGKKKFTTIFAVGIALLIAIYLIHYSVIKPFGKTSSIAVLPLSNLTGDKANDYIVEGIHDALIGELGEISTLRVTSRYSTLRYAKSTMLTPDIAADLKVDNIIEGSLISVDDSIHLIIQVIKAQPKEQHLMAAAYHDHMANILRIQSTIAKDVTKSIRAKNISKRKTKSNEPRQVNPEVYKAYLRGMFYLHQGSDETFAKGIDYLEKAIEADPGDPFAYAGIALGYSTMGHGQLNSKESFNRAVQAAIKAIKLDPTLDEPYTALSILNLYHDWNWAQAKISFENALAANPSNALANAHYAWYHILFNDLDNAIYYARKATEVEPNSPAFHAWLGLIYCTNNEYDKAEASARRALDLNENTPYGNLVLGWCYLNEQQYTQAISYHERLPQGMYWDTLLSYCYTQSGRKDEALQIWSKYEEKAKSKFVNPCYRGMMAGYLGKKELAFKYLNEAIDQKLYPITYINFYPCSDDIRNDIRFAHLLDKMNLPYYTN